MIERTMSFAADTEIKVGGYCGQIIDFILHEQLLDADTFALFVNQFRVKCDGINFGWRGEYWGKMMRGASLTYKATKNESLYRVIRDSVCDMLTTQDELGRFSTYTVDKEFHEWDLWGRKYVMLGMLYFLEICKSKQLASRIENALIKHADYIVDHIGSGHGKISIFDTSKHIGALNSCSILEPFVKLYKLTGKSEYLAFSKYIVDTGFCVKQSLIEASLTKDLYPYQFPVTKAYELMSCFEGLLEYYTVSEDTEHLKAVENFVEMIVKTDYTIIGASGCRHEFLDNSSLTQTEPATQEVMQETCVTVTFIKLCAKLLSITGNSKYADYIERSGLNALFGAVNNERQTMRNALARTWLEGGKMVLIPDHEPFAFDSYSPSFCDRRGLRIGGMQLMDGGRSYGCCVCIGSAGTAIMGLFQVMTGKDRIFVNLYSDCAYKRKDSDGDVRVKIRANPYKCNGAKISVSGSGKRYDIALRVPVWAEGFFVTVNGEAVESVTENGYLILNRTWNNDRIDVRFNAPTKMRVLNGKLAFTKGPIVLTADKRLCDIEKPIKIKAKDGETVRAVRSKSTSFACNVSYNIKAASGTLTLCDYAQAGKNYDEEQSGITVWHELYR